MIANKLKEIFNKWNTDKKCGECWVFVKTFNDHVKGIMNLYKPVYEDKCCTHIFLEGLRTKTFKEETITGTKTKYCDYYLHFK